MRSVVLLVAVLLGALPAAAQEWDPRGLQHTRAELKEMLERYEASAASSAYSETIRKRARAEAQLIRQRLAEGDIRVGDRVVLIVEGHEQLTDTFSVGAARALVLPEVGEIPLTGVLRSELQSHLNEQIGRFIRDPVVHARALVRLEITGAVTRPGYYTIPSDILLTDALMAAGGPLPAAALDRIRILRSGEEIWSREQLRELTIEGRTLDQLSVRAGDNIQVPQHQDRMSSVRDWLMVVASLSGVALLAERLGAF